MPTKKDLEASIAKLEKQLDTQSHIEKLLRLQRDLAVGLVTRGDLQEAFQLILDTALQIEGIDAGGIYLIDRATGCLKLIRHAGLAQDLYQELSHHHPHSPQTRLAAEGKPIYANHLKPHLTSTDPQPDQDISTYAMIPIRQEQEIMAVLFLASHTQNEIPRHSRNVIEGIAAQLGAVISRIETQEELGYREGELMCINRELQQEIVKHKQVREALEQNEAKYRALVEQSILGIVVLQGMRVVFANQAFARLSGYSIEELKNLTEEQIATVIHPEDRDLVWSRFRKRLEGKEVPDLYEFRAIRKDGSARLLEMHSSLIQFNQNPAVQAAIIDITERKQHEKALTESENRFRMLADTLPEVVFETDHNNRITYMNKKAFELTLYTQKDFDQGLMAEKLVIEKDREKVRQQIQNIFEGQSIGLSEYTALRKDGSTYPVLVHSSLILHNGRPAGLRGFVIDLSERKKTEQELLRSQKLESIGQLAGGIAHDFNNYLTLILGCCSLMEQEVTGSPFVDEMLKDIEKATKRARGLTKQLLTFSRGGAPVKKEVSINQILIDSFQLALSGSSVRCDFTPDESLWTTHLDEDLIKQAMSNIIINAKQSMPQGGIVGASAKNMILKSTPSIPLESGEYVMIRIEDQGSGIEPEILPMIFDPYFTTKTTSSGLGLAVSHSIIKHHAGHISVDSTPGKGTVFNIYLPAAARAADSDASKNQNVFPHTKGKILIMDDDPMIRNTVRRMLTQIGYRSDVAADGREAIKMYQQAHKSPDPFDLVMLDLTVPGGLGGKETIEKLIEFDPEIIAIVSSGYYNDPVMSDYSVHGFKGVLAKPYGVAELADLLVKLHKKNHSQ